LRRLTGVIGEEAIEHVALTGGGYPGWEGDEEDGMWFEVSLE